MQKQQAPIHAAIDIGSNTVHLVVAHCTPDDLDIIKDEVELVRIGESVTATGEISQQKRQQTIETLSKYKALAEQHGAGQTLVVATEAIRQASNSSEFLEHVERETGLKIHLINGDTEAILAPITFVVTMLTSSIVTLSRFPIVCSSVPVPKPKRPAIGI